MESHNVQRYVTWEGSVQNEGDLPSSVNPYAISYPAVVPREAECANLVMPVALSASHIAFASIRMEPIFMILSQSGATAAVQALRENKSVQHIDCATLRDRLEADRQVLTRPRP
jgi:hypothetical protein